MDTVRWATFDCFGTLVDWRHGIAASGELVAPGLGDELLEAYNRWEMQIQSATPTMRYRDVLTEGFRRACIDCGVDLVEDDLRVLATTIPHWPVFPDVTANLRALRAAGWNLALLTNCDRDVIGATIRRLRVPIDAVVTAEDAGAYKPAHQHFTRFRASFRPAKGDWVHVAQSHTHDMVQAQQLGIHRVWVNRLGEPHDPAVAEAVLPTLEDLVPTVQRVAAQGAGG
jgi:2-haloacid dehalogenase